MDRVVPAIQDMQHAPAMARAMDTLHALVTVCVMGTRRVLAIALVIPKPVLVKLAMGMQVVRATPHAIHLGHAHVMPNAMGMQVVHVTRYVMDMLLVPVIKRVMDTYPVTVT